jgi:hypothetical protein
MILLSVNDLVSILPIAVVSAIALSGTALLPKWPRKRQLIIGCQNRWITLEVIDLEKANQDKICVTVAIVRKVDWASVYRFLR